MFDIPSNPKIEKCAITKGTVLEGKEPNLVINEERTQKRHLKRKIKPKPKEDKQNKKETA